MLDIALLDIFACRRVEFFQTLVRFRLNYLLHLLHSLSYKLALATFELRTSRGVYVDEILTTLQRGRTRSEISGNRDQLGPSLVLVSGDVTLRDRGHCRTSVQTLLRRAISSEPPVSARLGLPGLVAFIVANTICRKIFWVGLWGSESIIGYINSRT